MLGRFTSRRRRANAPAHDSKIILARRGDGLGERLNGLVNAMHLAELLDVPFRFTWPEHQDDDRHAIVPASEFFSAEFVAAHEIGHHDTADGFPLADRKTTIDALRQQLASAERGLRVRNRPMTIRNGADSIRTNTADQFAKIGFHPRIEAAIEAARAVPLDARTAGIHLRAGDVLFGRFRVWTRPAHKVISAPVARELIERSRAEGREVLVFGQDTDLIGELCASTGATDAATLRPPGDLSPPEVAMFDMVLLSRCAPILAGTSGFAVQAAAIAGQPAMESRELIEAVDVVRLTKRDLALHADRYDAAHRSHAWWWAYYVARNQVSFDEGAELLGESLKADPTNPRARVRLAALCYREGEVERGDDVVTDAVVADVAAGGELLGSASLLTNVGFGGFDNQEIFADLERGAEEGAGPARVYRAVLRAQRGETSGAHDDAAAFLAYAAGIDRLADAERLEPMVMRTIELHTGLPGVARPTVSR